MSNFRTFYSWFLKRPKSIGIIVFLVMLVITGTIALLRCQVIQDDEKDKMSLTISIVKQNFEEVLKNSYIWALTLALTINDEGHPKDFEKISAKLIENNKSLNAVELVPNGIIKYIYPYEINKSVIDYNIFEDAPEAIKFEAKKSIESKIMFFAGPSKLKQGTWGIIGRLPVYKNNQFWGFSAVIIKLNTLLEHTGLKTVDVSKYSFQFSKKNPITNKEEFYLPGKIDLENKYHQIVTIPDGDWKLYIVLKDDSEIKAQIYVFFFLGFLLSLAAGYWIYSILKKPAELQMLIENQTNKILKKEIEFKSIFEKAPVGIAKVDTQSGRFITVNEEYCKITGYSREELLALDFQSITHPDDLVSNLQDKELLQNAIINDFHFEKRYITKSGSVVWINLYITILSREGGQVKNHIAIIENITNNKKAQQELDESFKLVSEQNKRLLSFSYIVSHNLRSHTSNIELISELLDSTKSKEERDEMIVLLKRVSKSLDETLRNLDEVVNIRSNINLKTERLSVHNYIERTIKFFEKDIIKKSATIKNNVSKEITIDYNIAYLESILQNFISNAIRYSHPDRKPLIILNFDIESNALIINDNGIGIDLKRNEADLFGMYKTFNNNPDAKGIGLFLSKNQIDALGGKIETESELGKGTTFTIYFK